jgi:hypothetical protein
MNEEGCLVSLRDILAELEAFPHLSVDPKYKQLWLILKVYFQSWDADLF